MTIPGSQAAIDQGCTCPVIDNHYGQGYQGQPGVYIYIANCPVHSFLKGAAVALGSQGGKASAKNLSKAQRVERAKRAVEERLSNRPHIKKVNHFLKIYPEKLESNEHKTKFDVDVDGKKSTYNPDYYCPKTGDYIEIATSKPNISEQRPKWIAAIKNDVALRVFWWEGQEITDFLELSPSEIFEKIK